MPILAWLLFMALAFVGAGDDDWDAYGSWSFPSVDERLLLEIRVVDRTPLWELSSVSVDAAGDESLTRLRAGVLDAPPVDAAVLTDGRLVLFERYRDEGHGALLTVVGVDGATQRVLDHRAVFGDAWDGLQRRSPWWRDFWIDELRGEVVLVDAASRLWAVDLEDAAVEMFAPPPDFDHSLGWGHWTQRLFSMERALDGGWEAPARFAPAVLVAPTQPLLWRIEAAGCCARLGLAMPEIREVFDLGTASERGADRWAAWAELAPAMGPAILPECVARLRDAADEREAEMIVEGLVSQGSEAVGDLVDALLEDSLPRAGEERLARALWAVQPADGPATLPTEGAWVASVRRVRGLLLDGPALVARAATEDLAALDPAAILLIATEVARRPSADRDVQALVAARMRLLSAPVPDPGDPRSDWLRLLEDRLTRAIAACAAGD